MLEKLSPNIFVVQPALPNYRISFFMRIEKIYNKRFAVYASHQPELGGLNSKTIEANWFHALKLARPILRKLEWQPGVLAIPLQRGDILVLSGQPRTLSNLVLIIKAKYVGAKVVWWGHFWSSTSRAWRAAIRFRIMWLADAILLYTDQEVDEYCARCTQPLKVPVVGLNNGIETAKIQMLRAPYDAFRRSRDLLFIGRVTSKSQLDLLIDALARVNLSHITLDIIGDGQGTKLLRRRADELGLSNRIAWHGEVTDEARIAKIANMCRLFVYPGAVGLSLIHGLTYGLPAIVHDNRWRHMPEIAAHRPGSNGAVFRFDDAESLARNISDLLRQPERLASMSAEAVATTSQTFNVEDMVRRFCAMVDKLE